jgi:hypothetical protein
VIGQWRHFRANEERHLIADIGATNLHTACGLTFHANCAREGEVRQCRNCRRIARRKGSAGVPAGLSVPSGEVVSEATEGGA